MANSGWKIYISEQPSNGFYTDTKVYISGSYGPEVSSFWYDNNIGSFPAAKMYAYNDLTDVTQLVQKDYNGQDGIVHPNQAGWSMWTIPSDATGVYFTVPGAAGSDIVYETQMIEPRSLRSGGEYKNYFHRSWEYVDKPPFDIRLSNYSISENDPSVIVGKLSTHDFNYDSTPSLRNQTQYSISGSDSSYFEYVWDHSDYPGVLNLVFVDPLGDSGPGADYFKKPHYDIEITATPPEGPSKTESFRILVTNSNTPPTAITLSNNSIAENTAGAVVGTLSVADSDSGDSHSLILSGNDRGHFEISNFQLKLKSGLSADYETKSSYSITVSATDSGNLSKSQSFTVNVTDVDENDDSSPGNDILDGFSGTGFIDGKGGLDSVQYKVSSNKVSFSENSTGQLVIKGSPGQSETLVDIERLQFTDKVYALDLNGNAGVAAKAIIASFGADSLNAYMSAALSVVDSGTSLESLCDLVVDLKLIDQLTGSSSNSSFVGHLFKNVVGRSPNLLENALYTNQLDNGTHTKSSLLAFAANTTRTEALVTANTIDLIGVAGSADGEILALQYDIGLG